MVSILLLVTSFNDILLTKRIFTIRLTSVFVVQSLFEDFFYLFILDQFSLNVENPVAFLGNEASGSFDGNPQKYVRGVPNLNITANCVVKFDENTNEFFADSRVLTVASTNGLFLSNNATFGSASAFAINIPKTIIEEVSYDEGDYLKLNATLKMVDGGSGNLINVRIPA